MSLSHVDMQLACRTKALSLTTLLSTAFSRASTATYTDVNGIVQTAAVDIPRNAHYVSGASTVLTESASTNSVLWSHDLTNGVWTKSAGTGTATQNAVGLDGTANTATTLSDSDAANGINWNATPVTVPVDSSTHTVSFWIKKDSTQNRFPLCYAQIGGGTLVSRGVYLNTQTGTSSTGFTNGTTSSRVVDGGLWWVVEIVLTNNSTASNTVLRVQVDPARGSTIGVDAVATTGSIIVGHVQVELNKSAYTSPIFTTTAAVTRAADIGSSFGATAQGYTRDTGSFITDGYEIGTEIRPTGFAANLPDTLTDVSALSITTRGTHAVEAAQLGRNFSIGLPSDFAWENLRFTPVQGVPYVKEEYLPGPMSLNSMGTSGNITVEPTYRLTVYVPQNSGISADGTYADALINLFAPSTEMLLPDGNVLFVRADVAPIRGQRLQQQGLSGIPVTIPLRAYINNADTTNPFYVVFTDSDGDIAIESSITAALADYQLVSIDSDGDPLAP